MKQSQFGTAALGKICGTLSDLTRFIGKIYSKEHMFIATHGLPPRPYNKSTEGRSSIACQYVVLYTETSYP
jgi:hypothetical protein